MRLIALTGRWCESRKDAMGCRRDFVVNFPVTFIEDTAPSKPIQQWTTVPKKCVLGKRRRRKL